MASTDDPAAPTGGESLLTVVLAGVDLVGADTEAHLAVRLRAVEADLEQHPLVEDAVPALSLPDMPSLTP